MYLDASVLVPAFIEEPFSATVDAFLNDCRQELLMSEFAAAEVAWAVSRLVRMGELDPGEAQAALADFDAWRAASCSLLDVGAADVRLAHAYVRRFELRLRAPDALHLAIAQRLKARLVTMDRRLAEAARELDIPCTRLQPG